MAVGSANPDSSVETTVPARLDRLPWARFHLMVVVALGITWVLDGLEVTIVGSLSGILQNEHTLHLSSEQIGIVASCYVGGAVLGAIVFGWLTDRFGRRTMFYITLVIYVLYHPGDLSGRRPPHGGELGHGKLRFLSFHYWPRHRRRVRLVPQAE